MELITIGILILAGFVAGCEIGKRDAQRELQNYHDKWCQVLVAIARFKKGATKNIHLSEITDADDHKMVDWLSTRPEV